MTIEWIHNTRLRWSWISAAVASAETVWMEDYQDNDYDGIALLLNALLRYHGTMVRSGIKYTLIHLMLVWVQCVYTHCYVHKKHTKY